jgi:hypothetical protein
MTTTQKLKDLEAAHRTAEQATKERQEALKKCADQVLAVEGEIATVTTEIEKLDALPSIGAKEQLAEENGRRRLRQLDEALERTRAAVAAAETELERAQSAESSAKYAVDREAHHVTQARLVVRLREIARELAPLMPEIDRLAPWPGAAPEGNAILRAGLALDRSAMPNGDPGRELWLLVRELEAVSTSFIPPAVSTEAARLSPQHIHR